MAITIKWFLFHLLQHLWAFYKIQAGLRWMSPESVKNERTKFKLIHAVRPEFGSLLLSVAPQGSVTLKTISRPLQMRTGADLKELYKADVEGSQIACALIVTDTWINICQKTQNCQRVRFKWEKQNFKLIRMSTQRM